MQQANKDLRTAMKTAGVPHFLVAAEMGVYYGTFSHWLQLELSEAKKKDILAAIDRVKARMDVVAEEA